MMSLQYFSDLISGAIEAEDFNAYPSGLYDPIVYTMDLEGKRLRPALTVLACYLYAGEPSPAMDPAIGIELFHNFTLLHDDIMDMAPIRRGKPSVYKKWDTNTAILSGDTMFAMAYQYLCKAPPSILGDVLGIFNQTAIEVCEGQQLDMDFEAMDEVDESQYIEMITLKTAVLLAASLSIGAYCGGATREEAEGLYEFGRNLGLAFQLKDDLLDVYGKTSEFGKISGGDILANKKTYLYIKALQNSTGEQRLKLLELYKQPHPDPDLKIEQVKQIFSEAGAENHTVEAMIRYHDKALSTLKQLNIPEEGKTILGELTARVISRKS